MNRNLIFAARCGLGLIGASLVALQSSRAQIVMETPAPIETEITKALGDPYRYDFDLPASPNSFIIAPRSYLDDLDPKIAPQNTGDKVLSTFATPGEIEPLSFAIYATDDLKNVTVAVSDLKAGTNILSASQITVRTVMRAPQRIGYWMKSDPQNYVLTNRFLPAFAPFDLQARQFREIWLSIQVPPNAAPGDYQGQVTISAQGKTATTLPLGLGVLPFTLQSNPGKRFGVYYRSALKPENHDHAVAELKDIKAHGNDLVLWSLFIAYRKNAGGEIVWDFSDAEKQMAWLDEAGLQNAPIFLNSNFMQLATLLGYEGKSELLLAAAIEKDNGKFAAAVKAVLLDVKAFAAAHPRHEIIIDHLDEVFNENRLPLQMAFAKATRQVPEFRQYATFHTLNEEANALRAQLDPYVDVRNNHGGSFEWWLARGHTIEEYKKELKASGDIAYFYQNMETVDNNPEWQRVTNGLYMWLNPFAARMDWIYYAPFAPDDKRATSGNALTLDAEGGHWFGFVAPATTENGTPIPTRHWEAWREGIDDLKYLYSLEKLVQTYHEKGRQNEARQAENWLRDLKAKIPKPQGLAIGKFGTPEGQSPFINAIAKSFSPDDYQQIRWQAAQFIIALQKNLKK